MAGVKIQPTMQIILSTMIISVATRFDKRKASCSPLICCTLSEGGDECRGQRAFGEQVAQKVGYAKGGEKRVVLQPGAEQDGENLIPNQAEHPARHDRDADDAGVARDIGAGLLGVFFSIIRYSGFPIMKNSPAEAQSSQKSEKFLNQILLTPRLQRVTGAISEPCFAGKANE